jgi:hypothetical protein
MKHHAGILQQRVQIPAVSRRREQAIERIGGQQQEQQETQTDQPHDGQNARHHGQRHALAETGHRASPTREHEQPQQHGSLMAAPGRGDAIGHGKR